MVTEQGFYLEVIAYRRREEEHSREADGMSLGERLLQKQIELEEAVRRNQMLSLRLEKLQVRTYLKRSTPCSYSSYFFNN